MVLFSVNERPEFIGLDESRAHVPNMTVEGAARLLASGQQERKNRALVDARYARDGADAHPFAQHGHNLDGLGFVQAVLSERLLARFCESGLTGFATEPLDTGLSVGSKTLNYGVLAANARHGLLFLREKPYNQSLGFECGLLPRLDSAPPMVTAIGGAFLFHRLFGALPRTLFKGLFCVPLIEISSVYRNNFCVFAFDQPREYLVNRSEWVFLVEFHAAFQKFVSERRCGPAKRRTALKHLSYCFGDASFRTNPKGRATDQGTKVADELFERCNLRLNRPFVLIENLKPVFCFFQQDLVVECHEWETITMTITRKAKCDNRWKLVIADAEDQIDSMRRRIDQLQGAIRRFRRRMETGEQLPEGLREAESHEIRATQS